MPTSFFAGRAHRTSPHRTLPRGAVSQKKTLYQLFQSKELLIEAIVESQIVECKLFFESSKDQKNAVSKLGHVLLCAQLITRLFPTPFFCSLKKYYHKSFALLEKFVGEDFVLQMIKAIEEGKAQKVFRQQIDSPLFTELFCWQMQHALADITLISDKRNEIYNYIGHLFLRGILINPDMIPMSSNHWGAAE